MEKKAKYKIGGFISTDVAKEAKVFAALSGLGLAQVLEQALRYYLDNHNPLDLCYNLPSK